MCVCVCVCVKKQKQKKTKQNIRPNILISLGILVSQSGNW